MDRFIIKTGGENGEPLPDRWVLGRGLSTDGLYILHTAAPFMMIRNAPGPCTVYLNGDIDPGRLNRLFAEAWQLLEIYKGRAAP